MNSKICAHDRTRQAVQVLRVLQRRKDNIFGCLPKDVAKIIAKFLWATRTEVIVPTKKAKKDQ